MTHPTAPHPDWQALLNASEADEAMQELHDRLDREAGYSPAPICPAALRRRSAPDPHPGEHHPQPSTALASRSAATGTGTNNEAASGASDALAA